MTILADEIKIVEQADPMQISGTVAQVRGLAVRVAHLPLPVGAQVDIATKQSHAAMVAGEVVGFDEAQTIVMPIGVTSGIRRGDIVIGRQFVQMVNVGEALLGRVIDAMGRPIDGRGEISHTTPRTLVPDTIDPMQRVAIDTPLATGIRAIDALISVGRGQRLGVVASPGIGKSVLLGMMARTTSADVNVIALVGERGREVRDFIHHHLADKGLAKSVVVCATGDEPPLMRLRAALAATTISEHFRDQGRDVLLIMDSVTRFCQAQRQIGLSTGEPPATKGYPPSVFSMLPRLLERCGRTASGSITGFFAVLVEGEDPADPIADAARGVLDGHVVLSKKLAGRSHWPAIDIVESISRVADDVTDAQHQAARRQVVRLIGSYNEVEDLLNIGAYAAGSNPDFDLAIATKPMIDGLLQQGRSESGASDFERTKKQLMALIEQIEGARRQLAQSGRKIPGVPGVPGVPGGPTGN